MEVGGHVLVVMAAYSYYTTGLFCTRYQVYGIPVMKVQLLVQLLLIFVLHVRVITAQDALFPDAGLEAAVRAQVFAKRNNQEPLTKEDVAKISQVEAMGRKIGNLAGLEHCVAVQMLDLGNNEITDLAPLAGLKLLQSLTLKNNKIQSIEPLKDLERMQLLDLSDNQVKDLAALAKMTNLRTLYLSNNQIEQIGVLSQLPKIWSLYLNGNSVNDWTSIGELKWLSSLNLANCNLTDLSFLKPLKRLSMVILTDNKIQDVNALIEMSKTDESRQFAIFWKLYLRGNPVDPQSESIAELKKLGARISFE